MIVEYNDVFFNHLSNCIYEFSIDYLKFNNPFLVSYVFIENDIPVGLISYSLIYDRIELEYLWTDASYRKRGIASKLIDKMLSLKGIKNITLEVNNSNVAAINLYKKYNFKIAAVRKNYYGSNDAYLMIREMM